MIIAMFVKLQGPRHTTTETGDSLTIRIPSRRNILLVAFLTLWLCGWLAGEIAAPTTFLTGAQKDPGAVAFVVLWLCFWTAGGAAAIYVWLWQLKGCEVVTLSPAALSLKRELFGLGRTKHYDATEIHNLRVSPRTYNPFDFQSGLAMWGVGGGVLAFDYGSKTYRFASGVEEAEARAILQKIGGRAPRLTGDPIAQAGTTSSRTG